MGFKMSTVFMTTELFDAIALAAVGLRELPSQSPAQRPSSTRSAMKSSPEARSREVNGYAMVGLLVMMAVMAIMMSVAMPVWKQIAQREKEEELIFRGQQYAHAIGLFQRKFANAMPPNVNVLVEQRFLRKKYKDPITNDDFALLTVGQAAAASNPATGASSRTTRPGQTQQITTTATPSAGRSGTPTAGGAGSAGAGLMNAFIGVVSKSKDKSIRLYQGKNHYNEWAFVYVPQTQAPGAGAAGSSTPGERGQPGGRGRRGQQPGSNPFGGRGRGGMDRGTPDGRGVNPGGSNPFPQMPMTPPARGRSGA
jgi:type II secretory pathway pseudopilin PulG